MYIQSSESTHINILTEKSPLTGLGTGRLALLTNEFGDPSLYISLINPFPPPQFRRSYVGGLYKCTQSEAAQLSALIAKAEFSLSELRPGSLQLVPHLTMGYFQRKIIFLSSLKI